MKKIFKIIGIIFIFLLALMAIEYFVMSKNSENPDHLIIKKKK